MTDAPRTLPVQQENYCLRLLCTYLLYERAHETEMRTMVEGMIAERHRNFHDERATGSDWRACRNQVCTSARLLLDQVKQPEVELNSFAVQLMQAYTINFRPQPDPNNPRQLVGITAKLVELSKLVEQAKATDPTKQTNSGVIIP